MTTLMAFMQQAGTAAEVAEYAAREAASRDLESFSGGWHGAVITILVIVAIAALVWWLLERSHH